MESIINAYLDQDQKLTGYDGSAIYLAENASADDISARLIAAGMLPVAEHTEAGNRYRAFSDGERLVTLYTASAQAPRLIVEAGQNLPVVEDAGSDAFPTTVTQLRLTYLHADCGMSYLIRLGDGRFVMLDGGYGEYGEEDRLYELMRRQNGDRDPQIAAWFITHPHGDHFETFRRFVDRYVLEQQTAALAQVIFNFPAPDLARGFSPMEALEETLQRLEPRQRTTARTGQRWVFCGTAFDILATCDDLYPDFIKNMNDASVVIRMTHKGHRALFPGDIEHRAADHICGMYPQDSLRCDILQVAHHGYWGGSDRFYASAEPAIVLWPCPDFWYQEIRNWDCNRYFREAKQIRHICIGGRADAALTLTDGGIALDYTDTAPLDYHEDFRTVKRASDLGWSCVSGGQSDYTPIWPTLGEGCCRLEAGQHRALCELRRPALFPCTAPTEISLTAAFSGSGDFGLVYNYATPTVWSEEAYLRLDPYCRGVEARLTLRLDPTAGTAALTVNGEQRLTLDYAPVPQHGLYLALHDAAIVLRDIDVTVSADPDERKE